MRMVQEAVYLVQHNAEASAMNRFNSPHQVAQKRFDFSPVDVIAEGHLKDRAQQIQLFIAHGAPRFPERLNPWVTIVGSMRLPTGGYQGLENIQRSHPRRCLELVSR
jgi:hypothetical protein